MHEQPKCPQEDLSDMARLIFIDPSVPRHNDCCAPAAGTEWVTGGSDGTLAYWTQTKKKPISMVREAHCLPKPAGQPAAQGLAMGKALDPAAACWIQSVASCRGSDLLVRRVHSAYLRQASEQLCAIVDTGRLQQACAFMHCPILPSPGSLPSPLAEAVLRS